MRGEAVRGQQGPQMSQALEKRKIKNVLYFATLRIIFRPHEEVFFSPIYLGLLLSSLRVSKSFLHKNSTFWFWAGWRHR